RDTMKPRFLFALLALSLGSTLAACGGDDEDASSSRLELNGVYRPVEQGPIGSITFSGANDYLLMPKACGGGGCAEIGTYRLDTASRVLVLEDATTHQTRSIALEILETSSSSGGGTSLVQSVKPLDLVQPGQELAKTGQETTTGGGKQLATTGNATTGDASKLIDTIKELLMNGQQMKQDGQKGGGDNGGGQNAGGANDPKADDKAAPKNDPAADCKQGIPTKDTPLDEVAAYFQRCPAGP
ncbi:MAG: hypothetical protein JWP87_6231, partial [Labilithrix sp.]|nr:hypothetical protein [Labilithrix sp.]